MMWNWYTEQIRNQENILYKPVTENTGSYIRLARLNNETLSVISDTQLDFMNLLVDAEGRKDTFITVSGSDYWTHDNNGVVLTRSINNNLFEIASGIFKDTGVINPGPYTLATINLNSPLSKNDIIRVSYKLRKTGETGIIEGSIAHRFDELPYTPACFTLLQNTPNPFNPSTTISFELPHDAHITLTIYSIQGQLLTVLADDILKTGFHSYIWNAKEMPSGVYLYSINADGYTNTKKMMLLK
jgi:hypothetical protein